MPPIIHKLRGLDTIRFICAAFVVLGHYGLPFSVSLSADSQTTRLVNGFLGCLFNGPAAVIVFFVISGLCIHYPNREAATFSVWPFYLQRFVRIGAPALAALFAWNAFHLSVKPPDFGIFWSILCEAIYYLLYPLLLGLARRWGWTALILTSYLLGLLLICTHLDQLSQSFNSYTALGLWTWVVGLPCWLSGCWLAENLSHFPELSAHRIWIVRLAVFFGSVALRIFKFHFPSVLASNCITLNLFAMIACIWLGCEVAFYRTKHPLKALEWGGTWSYSLYVIHPVAPAVFAAIMVFPLPAPISKLSLLLFAFGLSYLFFCLIELPSHLLSKSIGRRSRRKRAAQQIASADI